MSITLHRKNLVRTLIILYILLGLFFMSTSPLNSPVILLIAPVIWLYLCLSLSILIILNWTPLATGTIIRKDIIYSLVGAGVVCSLLLLQSVNQLSKRDLLLAGIFMVVAGFYARRLQIQQRKE